MSAPATRHQSLLLAALERILRESSEDTRTTSCSDEAIGYIRECAREAIERARS